MGKLARQGIHGFIVDEPIVIIFQKFQVAKDPNNFNLNEIEKIKHIFIC